MMAESIVWVAVALAAAPLAGVLGPPVRLRWPRLAAYLEIIGPWLYGLGPAYLALVRGAVLARAFGLYGRGGAIGWAVELVGGAGFLLAVWLLRGRLAVLSSAPSDDASILDEPRWCLYRAAGILWTGSDWWGLLAGFGLGCLEWAVGQQVWRRESRGAPQACLEIFRLSLSTILFALTGNAWITALVQGGLWKIVRRDAGATA